MVWLACEIAEAPLPRSGEVGVFRVRAGEVEAGRLAGLLSAEERRRAGQFRVEEARREFVAGRGALRILLGRALGEDPAALVFERTEAGKPFLPSAVRPAAGKPPAFNLAHSGGEVLIALGDVAAVGVDVERWRPGFGAAEMLEIAAEQFSAGEYETLAAAAEPARAGLFFGLWTGKEAVLKAHGGGLGVPLADVAFDMASDAEFKTASWVSRFETRTVRLPKAAGGGVFTVRWLEADKGFSAAVAVEGEARPVYTVAVQV